ncbi:S-adenosyl-L-methionine-dependent methyltransferase [Phytophthora cactorum]|nr:S-adenosyl-L-methionine-dependent methyltransferase [Phytophthora cactorum]
MIKHEEIKTMQLYRHLDRIDRRLKELGYTSKDAPWTRSKEKKVLDIGTGFGGTARLLAHRSGCKVDALELQPDLSEAGRELTRRCGLSDHVTHLNGDFLELPLQENGYDAVVGLLCFLHIGHWRQLFQRCYDSLKPGGFLYVDDFFLRGESLTNEDELTLKQDIYCADLLRQDEIRAVLKACGFEKLDFQDVTIKWRPYVSDRATQYHAALETHIARDGEAAAHDLDHFYTRVARLFRAGNVGGYTLIVRKPL